MSRNTPEGNSPQDFRVLHAALMLRPVSGIINQMQWEQKAANDVGLPWKTVIFCPKHISEQAGILKTSSRDYGKPGSKFFRKARDYIDFRREYYSWLTRESESFDAVVLRHSTSDPYQNVFIKKSKKPVYVVHHTLEVPELLSLGGVGGRLRAGFELLFGSLSNLAAAGVIGVTGEIIKKQLPVWKDYKNKSYRYPNGIWLEGNDIASVRVWENQREVPVLIFVASYFSPWHGLDLLLKNIRKSSMEFRLHIVGEMSGDDVDLASGDPRVVIHGHLPHHEVRRLIESADLALSSFALDRKDMTEACTLKTREYLAVGLPVYAGHRDVFPDDAQFFKYGPPDISAILLYLRGIAGISRAEILSQAREFIDKKTLLQNFHSWLRGRHRNV